jgi:hypothetical protein
MPDYIADTPAKDVTPAAAEQPTWKQEIDACRRHRETLLRVWKENVSYRRNKPLETRPTVDTVTIPVDWSRTKSKQAQLFFQVPEIKMRARRPDVAAAAPIYAAAINNKLEHEAKTHVMMDEVLADVINASGFGVAQVGFEGVFEEVAVPSVDTNNYAPEQLEALLAQNDGQVPTTTVQRPIYTNYYTRRISPANFLWPVEFTGSDWQEAEWLGEEGQIPLAEAIRRGWVDASYEVECADKMQSVNDANADTEKKAVGKYVRYSQIFYRKASRSEKEQDPRKIGHCVYVDGKDAPVVNEDLKWQKWDPESRTWLGLTTFPIKVMTLTTISDEAIPPSDSEIGRPQVKELIKSRSQMVRQRDRSLPIRWFDVNQVDPEVAELLRAGVYQDLIPMQGPGDSAIGEVARASYPRESFEFQRIISSDLDEAWAMSPNQQGFATPGDTSATEVDIMNQSANVRLDYERARVLRFFLEVAEGLGALMQLFQEEEQWVEVLDDNGKAALQAWDRTKIRGDFLFEAKPDSAARVDVGSKRVENLNLYKMLRQDPLINPQALVADLVELHGLDPTRVLAPPPDPQAKPANIRFSFNGGDLANPMVVALVQKNNPTPLTQEDLKNAYELMKDSGIPVMPPTMLELPQPGDPGQPPMPKQGEMPAETAHPGPAESVEPLNQRYEKNVDARIGG